MEKYFNITGICRPGKHYAADVSEKVAQTMRMVERGDYFIINRPRQYGKTTTLYAVENLLMEKGNYLVFNISFEGIGDDIFKEEIKFAPGFVKLLKKQATYHSPDLIPFLMELEQAVKDLDTLSDAITALIWKLNKKVIVLIDEVDKSSNNQLFISFLAMLRNKYLEQDKIKTFHSVVLAGVHDVKTLKLKIRPDAEQKYNSPWNIAADFKVDMNLQVHEIKPMLEEYAADRGVRMDTQNIAELLFYYTSGYPFLVSKLCKMLDEDFLPLKNEQTWTAADLELAVQQLVKESNANFDSLVKNLENSEELYDYTYKIAVENEPRPFNIHNPLTNLAVLHGIVTKNNEATKIHNRIYQEVIVNYMIDKAYDKQSSKDSGYGVGYKNANNTLNMEAVLLGFQTFMKKEYSKKDRDFLEKNGRLVFLAFLKPIINGSGYDFKEPQISEERRLDVVITYFNHKYLAELKLWRGKIAHENGLIQLADYLERQQLSEGYLLIFDHSGVKNWHSGWVKEGDKRIFAVWV